MFKKYKIINGKKYGPYLYENKRVGDKIVTQYLGKSLAEKNHNHKIYITLVLLALVVVSFGIIFTLNSFSPTGLVTINIADNLDNNTLSGEIRLSLKEGEHIPSDSLIVVRLGDQYNELRLDQVLNENAIEGEYYVSNSLIEGQGQGFGVKGSSTIYPELEFSFVVTSSENTDLEDVPDSEQEQTNDELNSELPIEESIVEEDTSQTQVEELPESDSFLTGQVISDTLENEEVVSGSVSKTHEFRYTLSDSESAEFVSGSVTYNGEQLNDDLIDFRVINGEVVVSTDYVINGEGFGEDFLGEEENDFVIDLADFDINKSSGKLTVELIYENESIYSAEKDIVLEENTLESNYTDVLNQTDENEPDGVIPSDIINLSDPIEPVLNESLNLTDNLNVTELNLTISNQTYILLNNSFELVRLTSNGSITLDMDNYFLGAESYEFFGLDLIASFEGSLLTLSPKEGFKGSSKGKVVAYAGNESLESNEFLILVSSGAVKITTLRNKIVINEPVKWVKNVTVEENENLTIQIPNSAENITVIKLDFDENQEPMTSFLTGNVIYSKTSKKLSFWDRISSFLTGRAISDFELENANSTIDVVLDENSTNYLVEYYTDAPSLYEEEIKNGKKVTVSGPDELNYTDVLTYVDLDNTITIDKASKIKVYWRNYNPNVISEVKEVSELLEQVVISEEDTSQIDENSEDTNSLSVITGNAVALDENNDSSNSSIISSTYVLEQVPFDYYDLDFDGRVDRLEWVTPHLSNQTFEIIFITRAEHLDENRTYLEDITDYVNQRDLNYSLIQSGDYIRITFEKNLSSNNDITLYAKSNFSSRIEVYEKNSNIVLNTFENISEDGKYQIFLTNLNESQDVFDLKVLNGDIEFDYIVDPTGLRVDFVNPTPANHNVSTLGVFFVNATLLSDNLSTVVYDFSGINYTLYNDSLILMLNLDNRSSLGENATLAKDLSRMSRNVTIYGNPKANTTAVYGSSYYFDGVDDNLQVSDFDSGGDKLTLSFWMSLHGGSADWPVADPLIYELTTNFGIQPGTFAIYYNDTNGYCGGNYGFIASLNGDSGISVACVPGAIRPNEWHHYTVIFDTSQDYLEEVKIFIDGGQENTYVPTTNDNANDFISDTLYIGSRGGVSDFANVSLDEIRIWNSSLTNNQIYKNYISSLNKINSTLWQLSINESKSIDEYLDDGSYNYSIYVADRGSQTNSTERRNINISADLIVPYVGFLSPTPATGLFTTNTSFFVNVSVVEQNLYNLIFNFNGVNYTLYNNSLILMLNFNNYISLGENATYFADLSKSRHNIFCSGSSCPIFNSNGRYNGAYRFDGINDYLLTDALDLRNSDKLTLSFWYNTSNYLESGTIMELSSNFNSVNDGLGLFQYDSATCGSATFELGVRDETGGYNVKCFNNTGSGWHHYTLVVDKSQSSSGETSLYIDGIKMIQDSQPFNGDNADNFGLQPLYIMSRGGNIEFLNGSMDEVLMWNRALGPTEVNQIYMSNLYKYNSTQWYLSINQTNSSISGLASNNYTYRVLVNDKHPNYNLTEQREIYINYDRTNPQIRFVDPTPSNGAGTNGNSIFVNVSSSDNNGEHYVATDFDRSLLTWLRFEQGNGTFFVDESSYGINFTCSGTSCPVFNSSGYYNGTYNFNGSSQYLTTPHGPTNLNLTGQSYSFFAWIHPYSTSDNQIILSKYLNSAPYPGYHFGVNIGGYSDGRLSIFNGNISNQHWRFSTYNVAANRWNFVGITYNSTSKGYTFYLNGTSAGSGTISGISDYNTPLQIGRYSVLSVYSNSSLDELMIFNRTLTSQEVLSLYNATANQYYNNFTNLVYGNHTFISSAIDKKGNKNSTETRIVSYDSGNLTSCGTLNLTGHTYVLQSNLTSTGTCFNITADGITINGNGNAINGTSNFGDVGIHIYNKNNVTIKNLVINNEITGIEVYHSSNLNISNVIIKDAGNTVYSATGISLSYINRSNIENSQVKNMTGDENSCIYSCLPGILIYMTGSYNNTFSNLYLNGSYGSDINYGDQLGSDYGFNIGYSSSNTFTNITLDSNIYGIAEYYSHSNKFRNILSSHNTQGVFFYHSNLTSFINTTFISNGNYGIFTTTSSFNNFTNITSRGNGPLFYLDYGSHYNFASVINSNLDGYGVIISGGSSYNNISSGTINGTTVYTFYLLGATTSNNIFENLNITNSNKVGGRDLYFANAGTNGTQLIDVSGIWNYTFLGAGGTVTVKKSNLGEIRFLQAINGSGNNFTEDIKISSNFVQVNTSKLALNKSANITLYNVPTNFVYPAIYRDHIYECGTSSTPKCTNLTLLDLSTVVFNVTSWSNYSIGEALTSYLDECANLTTPNANYTLINDILYHEGLCFNITADNITLNGNGFGIQGTVHDIFTEGAGISVGPVRSVNIRNLIIEDFFKAIEFLGTNHSSISSLVASNNFDGVILNNANYNNITNSRTDNSNYARSGGIALYLSDYNYLGGNNGSGNGDYGGISLSFSDHNVVENSTLISNSHGIFLSTSQQNIIRNNNLSLNTDSGIFLDNNIVGQNNITNNKIISNLVNGIYIGTQSRDAYIFNNTINSNLKGIFFEVGHGNIVVNNSILRNNNYGIALTNAQNNTISGGLINSTVLDAIYLSGSSTAGNNFTRISIENTSRLYYDVRFASAGINNNNFIDMQHLGNYTFTTTGGTASVLSNLYGEIKLIQAINGSGNNFTADIKISNRSAFINSSKISLNKAANITLYNTPGNGLTRPVILRDGLLCTNCYNFTSLSASTVKFNVSLGGNYSIGQDYSYVNSCRELNITGATYNLQTDINNYDSGNCFTFTADNITLNGNGYTIDGDGINSYTSYYGIYASYVKNITIRNLNIKEFGDYNYGDVGGGGGIYFESVDNSIINHVNTSFGSTGIVLSNSNRNNISYVNSSYNDFFGAAGNTAFYLGASNNNEISHSKFSSNYNGVYLYLSSNNTLFDIVSQDHIDSNFVISGGAYNSLDYINSSFADSVGINIASTYGNNISNSYSNGNTYGFYLSASSNNSFVNGTLNGSSISISLISIPSYGNEFRNISITNSDKNYREIVFTAAGINGTIFTDMPDVGNYSFVGVGGTVIFRKTSLGEIRFLQPINGSGANFTRDIFIGNNTFFVNSSQIGLNRSANITVYNLPTNFVNPVIYRDSINVCTSPRCNNQTSLNAGTVIFNVTGFSNYSVGEYIDFVKPHISFVNPTPINASSSDANSIYVNITSNDTQSNHYTLVDFDSSLMGWLRLEQGNGTFFVDESGQGNNGSCTSTWCPIINTSGYWNGSYTFDGVNDRIQLIEPAHSSTNINSGSVFAWIKTNGAGSGHRGIVVKQFAYGMFLINNVFTVYDWTVGDRSSGVNLADGVWHQVGFTFESGVTNGLRLYIDGVNVLNSTTTMSNQANGIVIGAGDNPGTTQFFNGSIDEVLLFNRTLNANEIKSLYNATAVQYYNNFTNLTAADHKFTGYAVDKFGNKNQTDFRTITLTVPFNLTSCNVLPVAGTIYNLASNISVSTAYCFNITADNITLNGNGYSLFGNLSNLGIVSEARTNITIKNISLYAFDNAILLKGVNSSLINDTKIYNSFAGLSINTSNSLTSYQTFLNNSNLSLGNPSGAGGYEIYCGSSFCYDYSYYNYGYCSAIRVYAYKIINGVKMFSSSYSESNYVCDLGDGDENTYYLTWSWNSVPGASGYRVFKYSDESGFNFDYYFDTTNNYFDDGAGSIPFDQSGGFSGVQVKDNTGIRLERSNQLFIKNSDIRQTSDAAVFEFTNNTQVYNLTARNSSLRLLYVSQSIGNNFTNVTLSGSGQHAMFLTGSATANNIFTNVSISATTRNYRDLFFNTAGINGTQLVDMPYIGNYSFTGAGGTLSVKKTGLGDINFLRPVNGTGNNFTSDISFASNLAFVNSSKLALNKSANITLYGLSTSYSNPVIYRDGINLCTATTSPSCYNFTSLNAGTVIFNVSSWSNYSIGESLNVSINSCGDLSTPNALYTLTSHISTTGSCFNITADNITLNGNGYSITGDATYTFPWDYGIYASGRNNITIKNFANITKFMSGIVMASSSNSSIFDSNLSSNNVHAISLSFFDNVSIYNINIPNQSAGNAITFSFVTNSLLHDIGIDKAGTGISMGTGANYNKFYSINISNSLGYGVYLSSSSNNYFYNFNVSNGSSSNRGIVLSNSNNNVFENVTSSANPSSGFEISGNNNSLINIKSMYNNASGIFLSGSHNSTILNANLSFNRIGIYLSSSHNNTLTRIESYSNTLTDLYSTPHSSNNTYFVDSKINNYSILVANKMIFKNSTYGELRFLEGIIGNGSNLFGNSSSEIIILNNTVKVNSLQSGLNLSANITLYGLSTTYTNPVIYRDGINLCNPNTVPSCYNFTSLNAGTVVFNVSSWSNYSIGEGNIQTLTGCANLSVAGNTYLLQNNIINQVGTCFNITADNITLNGNGYSIDGDDTDEDYGVYVQGVNNITVKNFANISDFGDSNTLLLGSMLFRDSNYSTIQNITFDSGNTQSLGISNFDRGLISDIIIINTIEVGLAIEYSDNNTFRNIYAYDNGVEGILINSESNYNSFVNITSRNPAAYGFEILEGIDNMLRGLNLTGSYLDFGAGGSYVSGATIYDSLIDSSSFYLDQNISITNTTFGNITFNTGSLYLSAYQLIGRDSSSIVFRNASVYIASNFNGANINVTLFGVGDRGFVRPVILKDGSYCKQCYNFTPLTSPNVIFNISGYGNFSIGQYYDLIKPIVQFVNPTPANGSYQSANSIYVNITSSDTISDHYTLNNLDGSLVMWHRMETSNGTLFVDETGKNNGTCSGTGCPSFNNTVGYWNGSYTFDGTSDLVDIAYDANTNAISSSYTMSAWVNFHAYLGSSKSPDIISHITNAAGGIILGYTTWGTNAVYAGHLAPGPSWICNPASYALNSGNLTVWHHYVSMYNGTDLVFYVDGNEYSKASCTLVYNPSTIWRLGRHYDNPASYGYLPASVDEIMVFNRSLSPQEIKALYNATANQYYNNFTSVANVNHTLVGYSVDKFGNKNNTETRYIFANRMPTVPVLSYPLNFSSITNRTPMFNWTGSDVDGDTLRYELNITCYNKTGSVCSTKGNDNKYYNYTTVGARTNYTLTNELKYLNDYDYYYNWSVRAYDGFNFSNWSSDFRVNLNSLVVISLPVDNVNFGSLGLFGENDTTDNSPSPFVIQNDGNSIVNITMAATDLWSSVVNPNDDYRFKVNNASFYNANKNGSFDWGNSITSFTPVPNSTNFTLAVRALNYSDSRDICAIDIHVKLPSGEPNGARSSVITFMATLDEAG